MKRTTKLIAATTTAVVLAVGAGTTYVVAGDNDQDNVEGDTLERATDAALAATGGGTVTEVEADDGGYDVEVRLDDGTDIDVDLAGDFTVLRNEDDGPDDGIDDSDEDDLALDDTERQRASDAALAETGSGTVTDVEHDNGGYDVEVRLDDGTDVDVELSSDFDVLRSQPDD